MWYLQCMDTIDTEHSERRIIVNTLIDFKSINETVDRS